MVGGFGRSVFPPKLLLVDIESVGFLPMMGQHVPAENGRVAHGVAAAVAVLGVIVRNLRGRVSAPFVVPNGRRRVSALRFVLCSPPLLQFAHSLFSHFADFTVHRSRRSMDSQHRSS